MITYTDAHLGPELVRRGGTCSHKLWLDRPWRYSEDLDDVRTTAGEVDETLAVLQECRPRVTRSATRTAAWRRSRQGRRP